MALAVAECQPPRELPVTLSIGTKNAFAAGDAYHYRFVEELGMYICDHQTSTNAPGEVMAICVVHLTDGKLWYIAQEGELVNGPVFRPRQIVFRTTERFWEAGAHNWQMNANSSSTNSDNRSWGGTMSAITKLPDDVLMIPASVGLLPIADA